jgi:hypothetical protein
MIVSYVYPWGIHMVYYTSYRRGARGLKPFLGAEEIAFYGVDSIRGAVNTLSTAVLVPVLLDHYGKLKNRRI